jgi:methylmalonyl-CoA mutase N-terminal domain/subunit
MVTAIERGYPQGEIERRAYEHQQAVEKKQRIVVGVNAFVRDEVEPPAYRVDPGLEEEQVARVRAVRAARDPAVAKKALAALDDAARGTANLVPRIIDAVKARSTVGEIADVLRGVFGEYQPSRSSA